MNRLLNYKRLLAMLVSTAEKKVISVANVPKEEQEQNLVEEEEVVQEVLVEVRAVVLTEGEEAVHATTAARMGTLAVNALLAAAAAVAVAAEDPVTIVAKRVI